MAYSRPARRDIGALDASTRRDVMADIDAYAEGSSGFDVARLEGVDALRLMVGSHRAIFRETATTITVLAIRHRAIVYDRIRRKK